MKLIENFQKLSIHRQIQIGVFSVSFCVGFLTISLLAINSFILINLCYYDAINLLNQKENDSIESVGIYASTLLNVITDSSKLNIQIIRNFIENNKRNQDFLNNLENLDYKDYMIDDFENRRCMQKEDHSCIFYKVFDSQSENDPSFLTYKKIFSLTIPIMKKVFDQRVFNLPSTQFINYIQLISNKYQAVFYYPESKFNTEQNYNQATLQNSLVKIAAESADNYENRTLVMSPPKDPLSISKTISKNPFLIISTPLNYKFPYSGAFNNTSGIISTSSANYKKDAGDAVPQVLQDPNKLDDVILGDWSSSMVDIYTFVSIQKFPGTKFIASKLDENQSLITQSSCHYLIKFYELQNNYSNYTNQNFEKRTYTVGSCFKNQITYDKFNKYFSQNELGLSKYDYIQRKAKFIFFNDYYDRDNPEKGIFFKIFKFKVPDARTRITMLDSSFFTNFQLNIYIIKNYKYSQYQFHKIRKLFNSVLIYILFYNFAGWYVILFIIVLILMKITDSISNPINNLINFVNSIESEKDNKNKISLEGISFPDDKYIDDLFKICKSLIKGGFKDANSISKENSVKKNINNLINAYNNISSVKTNNMLILDEFLNEVLRGNSLEIFSYKNSDYATTSTLTDIHHKVELDKKNSNSDSQSYLVLNSSPNKSAFKHSKEKNISKNLRFFDGTDYNSRLDSIKLEILNTCDSGRKSSNSLTYSSRAKESDIYNFIVNEDSKFKNRGYLFQIFMRITNEGSELKIVKFNNIESLFH